MTVYIDVLFLNNLFMDMAILFFTSFLSKRCVSAYRILIGGLILALYGSLLFFPQIDFIYSAFLKIIVSFAVNMIIFGKRRILRTAAVFWLVSIMAGGVVLSISTLTDFGEIMQTVVSNGVMYFNTSPTLLISGCIILFVLINVYRRVCIKSFSKERLFLDISFLYMGTEYKFKALIDTGCEICEPLSGSPAIVVSKRVLRGIVFTGSKIPVNTVAGEKELNLILPEKVDGGNAEFKISPKTVIAVTDSTLNADGLYDAVINPNAVEERDKAVNIFSERVMSNE